MRNSGPRSNAWSRNKRTNLRSFDPQNEELSRVIEKYYDECEGAERPIYRQISLHEAFVMPVTLTEVKVTVDAIPAEFTDGLKGVFLLGGSQKQADTYNTYSYGCYLENKIYLHPYPKNRLKRKYAHPPKPHILIEYQRAGVSITQKPGEFIIEFTEDALRHFYLRDVLIHEVGHHVDRSNFGKKRKSRMEPFAEWFATEYGFRLQK
jgi:hypothetical protein